MHVDEHTIEIAGAPVFYRRAGADDTPVIYLHSVPTSSDDWVGALERHGGLAPDLLGFGRSGKGGHLEYSLPAYVEFLTGFLGGVGVDRPALVGHGWGAAIALAFAQRYPERVRRLVLVNAVPLLDGFTWPGPVRRVLRPGLGELWMGAINQRRLAKLLRSGATDPGGWSDERVAAIWAQFDQGTQRAFLRLHRSIDAAGLAAAGSGLAQLSQPSLVVWGEDDPWLDRAFGDAYAARLSQATLARVPGAGHWPWLEQPGVLEQIGAFVTRPA
ncbi:MAG: alpha/beta fold hydrolase [Solirubrobacteraceae bacterium]